MPLTGGAPLPPLGLTTHTTPTSPCKVPLFTRTPFKYLADRMAMVGVGSIRYTKLGVGVHYYTRVISSTYIIHKDLSSTHKLIVVLVGWGAPFIVISYPAIFRTNLVLKSGVVRYFQEEGGLGAQAGGRGDIDI